MGGNQHGKTEEKLRRGMMATSRAKTHRELLLMVVRLLSDYDETWTVGPLRMRSLLQHVVLFVVKYVAPHFMHCLD